MTEVICGQYVVFSKHNDLSLFVLRGSFNTKEEANEFANKFKPHETVIIDLAIYFIDIYFILSSGKANESL